MLLVAAAAAPAASGSSCCCRSAVSQASSCCLPGQSDEMYLQAADRELSYNNQPAHPLPRQDINGRCIQATGAHACWALTCGRPQTSSPGSSQWRRTASRPAAVGGCTCSSSSTKCKEAFSQLRACPAAAAAAQVPCHQPRQYISVPAVPDILSGSQCRDGAGQVVRRLKWCLLPSLPHPISIA